jgi:hypothetical protein
MVVLRLAVLWLALPAALGQQVAAQWVQCSSKH